MKILILSCNTGEGHNSSAKALKVAMDARGIECDVQDTLALVSADISKNVSEMYVYSTKGSLFERAYRLGAVISNLQDYFKSPVYMANKLYTKKLYDFIVEGGYDAVVCVHLFPAEAVTALKRKAKLEIPTVFVMTDYTCIPFLPETELDKYVIAHPDLEEEFVEKGIPREKIVPLGIPVDESKFTVRTPKSDARRQIEAEFGWEKCADSAMWFLVMGGSMGFGNMGELLDKLLSGVATDDRVICICGRNSDLKNKLTDEFEGTPSFRAVGFTDKVPLLMDASDVLFTKPGGITSTEAVMKHIPLIHTEPIPGLEDHNAKFFHYHNMSYSTIYPDKQAAVALRLCSDEAYRKRMTDAQERNCNPKCCSDIIALLDDMVK